MTINSVLTLKLLTNATDWKACMIEIWDYFEMAILKYKFYIPTLHAFDRVNCSLLIQHEIFFFLSKESKLD